MRNEDQKSVQGGAGTGNSVRSANANGSGFIPTSFKSLQSCLRIVSSGASAVASTVKSAASAASAIVEREADSVLDQVHWAGFDKLEYDGVTRLVLLLCFRHGFQVWDVEEANNVHNLVSRVDCPVSFVQILPDPFLSKQMKDKFSSSRPMLIVCADGCLPGGSNSLDKVASPCNGTIHRGHDLPHGRWVSTVWFYSLRSQSYVDLKKFGAVVLLVRCSPRVIAVLHASQILCYDAATLEMDYSILTNPVVMGCGSGGIGFGPLALGPRWMAYSGSAVEIPNSGRVNPQELAHSASFSAPTSNGSLVAHYALESSKQIAAGIATLGDMGYKKLSRYYSELLPDGSNSQSRSSHVMLQGTANGQFRDADDVGMVIVRDMVKKTPITQFRAHKSPISSLCFDPSGILLVTASVQGHNINVFQIIPGCSVNSSESDPGASYVHLYRLQRGFTNAVIQDISFSGDSERVVISSSRGTSHLFAISPFGFRSHQSPVCSPPNTGALVFGKLNNSASAPPTTLSVVSRIRNGSNGWRHTVSGAAAAATGRWNSLPGAIAVVFHDNKVHDSNADNGLLKRNKHLLAFSSPGCLIQYAVRILPGQESVKPFTGASPVYELGPSAVPKLVLEPMRKWNIWHKQTCEEKEENIDIYGENGNSDCIKVFPEVTGKRKCDYYRARNTVAKNNMSSEERHHMYISEVELQMHQPRIPLWAKAEVYFQAVVTDGLDMDDKGGEIEVERIPVRVIEARTKELVPVSDSLQAPKFQQGMSPALNGKIDGAKDDGGIDRKLLCQKSEEFKNRKLIGKQTTDSLELTSDMDTAVAKLQKGAEEIGPDGFHSATDPNKGYVNNNDFHKADTHPEAVDNSNCLVMQTHFNFVNNSVGVLKVENQFEDGGN